MSFQPPVKRLSLENRMSFQDKLNAVIEFLKIETIYCYISAAAKFKLTGLKKPYQVKRFEIPGTTPDYLQTYLRTVEEAFNDSLDGFLSTDLSYQEITRQLIEFKRICLNQQSEFDL